MNGPSQAEQLLQHLLDAGVRLVVIGSAAAIAHGIPRRLRDLDVLYDRALDNIERLADCLSPLEPYPRGAEPGLDVPWDVETIEEGYSFIMSTTLGDLDLFAELSGFEDQPGGGLYEGILPGSQHKPLFERTCDVLSLPQLITNLRASGREKDLASADQFAEYLRGTT